VVFDEDPWNIRVITQVDLTRAGVAEIVEDLAKLAYSHARCDPSFPRSEEGGLSFGTHGCGEYQGATVPESAQSHLRSYQSSSAKKPSER